MKTIIFGALIMVFGTTTYAQDVLITAKVKKEEVPMVVIESIEEDFPDETIVDFYGIPFDLVEDVWYVDVNKSVKDKNYDTYMVNLSGKNGKLTAVYDKDGNLVSEHEKLKNVALPRTIQKSIARYFPGWSLAEDKMIMTAHKGDSKKVHYKVKLTKGDENFYAVLDANGNLIKGHQHSVHHKMLARKKRKK